MVITNECTLVTEVIALFLFSVKHMSFIESERRDYSCHNSNDITMQLT